MNKYFIIQPTADGAVPDVYERDPRYDEGHEEHTLVFSGSQEDCETWIKQHEGAA